MNARKRDGTVFMLVALLGIAGSLTLTGCGGDDSADKGDKPLPAGPAPKNHPPMPLGAGQ